MCDCQGRTEYGKSFQLVQSCHIDLLEHTVLCKIENDGEVFRKQGGVYGYQLIDAILHASFYHITKKQNTFAGGMESIHFIRE